MTPEEEKAFDEKFDSWTNLLQEFGLDDGLKPHQIFYFLCEFASSEVIKRFNSRMQELGHLDAKAKLEEVSLYTLMGLRSHHESIFGKCIGCP